MSIADEIKFDDKGLIPAVAQDAHTGEVLMVAYMNRESLEKTIETGLVHYWSRSRNELWQKGGTSGNVQRVEFIKVDCDADTVLVRITQEGAACHKGYRSCFFREVDGETLRVTDERVRDPREMYGQ